MDRRKHGHIYRAMSLVTTERTTQKTLKYQNNTERDELMKGFKKQLGQRSYEYGFIINRIEKYFKKYSGNENVIEESKYHYIIRDTYKNFMEGIKGRDRKQVTIAMRNNKFSKIKLYKDDPEDKNNTVISQEFKFISFLLRSKINKRLVNLDKIEDVEAAEIPISIEIWINKAIFTPVFKVCQGLKLDTEIESNCMRGIADLPIKLKELITKLKNELKETSEEELIKNTPEEELKNYYTEVLKNLKSVNYTDRLRTLTEKVYQRYDLGKEKRKIKYFDFDLNEIIKEFYPGYKKRKEHLIKIEIELKLIISVLGQTTAIYNCEMLDDRIRINIC